MQSSTDPRPVVVAVDDSDSARDAAAWAADLAADWSAPLHLVHVVPGDPQDRPLDPLPGWLTTLLDVAERAGARPCTAEAQPGDLAATIAARAVGARMVVLGSYGAGAFAGMLAGTTSRAVVEQAACPVAVVRGSAPRLAPPRSGPVVVGVDGSAAGVAALGLGADLGRRSDVGWSPCIAGRTSTPPRKEAPTGASHRRGSPQRAHRRSTSSYSRSSTAIPPCTSSASWSTHLPCRPWSSTRQAPGCSSSARGVEPGKPAS
jgi:nucleotide-binding universal stress UspA family protein